MEVCRLPVADRAQRTAEFRALFESALVKRTRLADQVEWELRASDTIEAESRRLAALEAHCCNGLRFEVVREQKRVLWRITATPESQTLLDAFFAWPDLVSEEASAAAFWEAVDGARCGPSAAAVSCADASQ